MIRTRSVVTFLIRNAACVLFTSTAAAADRVSRPPPEAAAVVPSTDCPYIAKVCALIADPAVRNHVGLAEYAWDFNAPDRADAYEEAPSSGPGYRLARSEDE